jgi:hypothetical protein
MKFRDWYELGYDSLTPVSPPGSDVPDAGKSPANKYADGWGPRKNWNRISVEADDTDAWEAWGGNLGLVNDGRFFVLDVDVYDEATANRIEARAREMLGDAPRRVGQWPKRALLYGASEKLPALNHAFGGGKDRIETTSLGKHIVVQGTHPGTGKPYEWDRPLPQREDLPHVTRDRVIAFFERMGRELGGKTASASQEERALKEPEELTGDHDLIREAVKRTPNPESNGYDDYITMGQAIRGAFGPGHEEDAFDVWDEWASRWEGGYDPDAVRRHWDTMKPSRSLGAMYVLDRAGGDMAAKHFFQPYTSGLSDLAEDMFGEQPSTSGRMALHILSDDEIQSRPDPEWLIENFLPEAGFNILYGDPGTKKSFVALDMALHIATGAGDWHGEPVKNRSGGAVLYIAGEGEGDFKLRLNAWKAKHYLPGHTIPKDRFGVVFAALDFRSREDIDRLKAAVAHSGYKHLSLVVIDTLARMTPGADENATQDMGQFVKACDEIRMLTGASTLAIHHANKQGGLRGASALIGAADSIFKMNRHKGSNAGTLKCEKMKAGTDSTEATFAFDKVVLGEEADSLVPRRMTESEVKKGICTPEMRERILASISAAWDAGEPWTFSAQARSRCGQRIVAREHDVPAEVAEQWLRSWMEGADAVLGWGTRDAKRHREGLYVLGTVMDDTSYPSVYDGEDADGGGIFG